MRRGMRMRFAVIAVKTVIAGSTATVVAAGCPSDGDRPERAPAFEQQAPTKVDPEPTPGDAAQDEDPRARVYAEAMDGLADEIIDKTRAGADRDFTDYAQAKEALQAALPQGSLSKLDEALIDASISAEDMAAFMRDHPEYVQSVGARFTARLATVEPELAVLIAKVAALAPPAERDEVVQMLEGLGYGHLLEAAVWEPVTDAAALARLATRAAEQHKALLLDVRAKWCMPCTQLEKETFAAPPVRALLQRSFVLARLDVTDPDPPAAALQALLGADTLPAVLAWKDPGPLATTLGAAKPKPVPTPDLGIHVFVTAAELLPQLEALTPPGSAPLTPPGSAPLTPPAPAPVTPPGSAPVTPPGSD